MKYAALTLNTLALAILLGGALGMALKLGSGGRPAPVDPVSVTPPTAQQLKEQADTQAALDALREVARSRGMDFPQDPARPPLITSVRPLMSPLDSIFASSEPVREALPLASARRAPVLTATSLQLAQPRINVVLQAGSEGRAMVDGRLVRVGDAVADGLVVKSIAMETVTFDARGTDMRVPVPLERLRVLGAFPDAGGKGR